ncbi:MAG: PEP-CTERM sorting domain-containing protein [Fimbriimonadaceae bacterium]|jgi:hypothetical protein|nr:PEP-CTERM sorting domain-containing protein [Fimbriimonadaceae bacterium]
MTKFFAISLITVALAAAANSQVLVEGFNNSGGVWSPDSSNQLGSLQYSTTIGVTEGTHSLMAKVEPGYKLFINSTDPSLKTLMALGGTLSFDITVPTDSFNVHPVDGPGYFEALVVHHKVWDDWTSVTTPITMGSTQSVSFAIPAVGAFPNLGLLVGLNIADGTQFGAYTQGTGLVYIDNMRFTPVPEPFTMGILALGAAVAARRRKAKR